MTISNRNIMRIALGTGVLLLIPLVLTLLGSGVDGEGFHWTLIDFVFMGGLLFGAGLAYEMVARRSKNTVYRIAFAVGVGTAFLLVWMNGAVGIIGSENQPANLLYGGVFGVGLVGSIVARFQPSGMARTLFAVACVQLLVPAIAVWIWPDVSWGEAGMGRVLGLNAFFAVLFAVSALLFRRAAQKPPPARAWPV